METIKILRNVEGKNRLNFQNNKLKLRYPHHDDENFQKLLTLKKEFQYKYDGEIKDIVKESENVCDYKDSDFELAPHQEFIKKFIHPKTPYNGILLYHGMGSGKTCSAIGITEQMRKYNKNNSNFKKIMIVASPNIQNNFKVQLFDPSKLNKENDVWNLNTCVGKSLLYELKDYQLNKLSKEQVTTKINSIIRNNYLFVGYERLANYIQKIINVDIDNEERKNKIIKKRLLKEFLHRMIVIDEAHNIRITNDSSKEFKKVAYSLKILLTHVQNMKLVLLSGTPIYNDPREILFLLNILNLNDGRSIMSTKDVFDKNQNFKVMGDDEIGKRKLIEKANGYISFIRGENPYSFPYKVYPNDYKSKFSSKLLKYPTKQYNGINIDEPIKYLDLFLTEPSEIQLESYKQNINSDGDFGSNNQEDAENKGYAKMMEPISSLNISYPSFTNNERKTYITGKDGIKEIMKYKEYRADKDKKDRGTEIAQRYNYEYEDFVPERVYSYENIGKYSSKIKAIVNHIINGEGIVLVYSQYIEGGLLPLALCLEELGFKRSGRTQNFMKNPENKKFNLLTKNHENDKEGKFVQAYYSIISGEKMISPNNNEEMTYVTDPKNIDGSVCKVVLISQAGSEGLDFQNLRQVHIMDPWYNLNRIEQIIGRAVRNCSHKKLPINKRNVQVFLHASKLNDDYEAIDTYIYRYAERKAEKIGKVLKLLKSISVDCLLHHEQTNFSNMNQKMDIKISTGDKLNIQIGDKSYSSICDYQEDCNYSCYNTPSDEELNISSYDYDIIFNDKVVDKIRILFSRRHLYFRDEIINLISNSRIQPEEIDFALEEMISNDNYLIIDKYLRKGTIINVKNMYIFQPIELDEKITSIEDKVIPITRKIKSLLVQYDKEKHEAQNKKRERTNSNEKSKEKEKSNKSKENKSTIERISKSKTMRNIENVLVNIEKAYTEDNIKKLKTEKDFYLNYSRVIDLVNNHVGNIKIDNNLKEFILFQHIDETLMKKEKIDLLNYLYQNEEILKEREKRLFQYFDMFTIKPVQKQQAAEESNSYSDDNSSPEVQNNDNKKYIIIYDIQNLVNETDYEIYMLVDKVWTKAHSTDYDPIKDQIKKILNNYRKNITYKYYGFMEYSKTKNEVLLKFKDTTVKSKHKGKGTIVINIIPKELDNMLKKIMDSDTLVFNRKELKVNHKQLEMTIEIALRYLNITNKKKSYFQDPLESVIVK